MRGKPIPSRIGRHDNNKPCSNQQTNGQSALTLRLRKDEIRLPIDDPAIFSTETGYQPICVQLHGVGIRPQEADSIRHTWQRGEIISFKRNQQTRPDEQPLRNIIYLPSQLFPSRTQNRAKTGLV